MDERKMLSFTVSRAPSYRMSDLNCGRKYEGMKIWKEKIAVDVQI